MVQHDFTAIPSQETKQNGGRIGQTARWVDQRKLRLRSRCDSRQKDGWVSKNKLVDACYRIEGWIKEYTDKKSKTSNGSSTYINSTAKIDCMWSENQTDESIGQKVGSPNESVDG